MLLLFSLSAMSDSLRPHGLQHARLPCPFHHPPEFAQTHVHWGEVLVAFLKPLHYYYPQVEEFIDYWMSF